MSGEPQAEDDGATTVVAISCGSAHTVALLDCNVVVSWGGGEDGQLGHGDAEECTQPKAVHALLDKNISAICCGAEYTIAFSQRQRNVFSWGWGDFGRLGHGDCNDVFLPQELGFFSGMPVKAVACGDTHTLVTNEALQLYTFGRNQNGQLGHGNTADLLSPKLVEGFAGTAVASIAAGAEHSLASTSDGRVFAWGWGRYGNLGDNDRQDRYSPTQVHGLEGVSVSTVACGWRHSVATASDGRVFTFGWSKYGQLGHADNNDRLVPTEVAALTGKAVVRVAGGWRHTAAADDEGRTYAWGWNKFGQLGLGDTEDRAAPTEVPGLTGQRVALLACGWRHTVAVTADGVMYSWGRGVNGQLGHGDEQDAHHPKALQALSRGRLTRAAILATATAQGGHVAPADRYAVVPDDGGAGGEGGGDDGGGEGGGGAQRNGGAFLQEGGPASKKARWGQDGGGDQDATVPGAG